MGNKGHPLVLPGILLATGWEDAPSAGGTATTSTLPAAGCVSVKRNVSTTVLQRSQPAQPSTWERTHIHIHTAGRGIICHRTVERASHGCDGSRGEVGKHVSGSYGMRIKVSVITVDGQEDPDPCVNESMKTHCTSVLCLLLCNVQLSHCSCVF